jgi:hypothetical protein
VQRLLEGYDRPWASSPIQTSRRSMTNW